MPAIQRIIVPTVDHVPLFSIRFGLRLLFNALLSAVNVWIVVDDAPALYRVNAGHPAWTVGVTLLFAALFASLARVWFVTLRRRLR